MSLTKFVQRNLFWFVHIKGLLHGFGMRTFSQFGEDRVLMSLLKGTPSGTFVDVGAYHPMHYSNTYALYKKGWSGVNIEPNPNATLLFSLHRPRDITINSGITEEVTAQTYYMFNHQSCNTFSEEQKESILKKPFIAFIGEKQVRCVPLQKIINEYLKNRTIDLLNVDVEGQNLKVLKTLDWGLTQPTVLCVEDDAFSFEEGSELHHYIAEKGYTLYARVGLSSIYKRKG